MAEKRFKADKYYFEIWDNDDFLLSFDQTVDLLNQLNEENEQLKSKNRGLKSELQIFKEDVTHSNLQINKLTDDNEELKKEVKQLKNKIKTYNSANELLKKTIDRLRSDG